MNWITDNRGTWYGRHGADRVMIVKHYGQDHQRGTDPVTSQPMYNWNLWVMRDSVFVLVVTVVAPTEITAQAIAEFLYGEEE